MEDNKNLPANSQFGGQKEASVKKSHRLVIEARKSFCIFGITDVLETTESSLSVRLSAEVLNIKGSGITLKKLAIDEGVLEAAGIVDEIKYQAKREKVPLLKKLFK